MTGQLGSVAAWLLVGAPAVAALVGLPLGRRSRGAAVGVGVGGAAAALFAAVLLVIATWDGAAAVRIALLGPVDLGRPIDRAGPVLASGLDWSVSAPTALVALAVALVALGVQVYASGYLVPHAGDTGPLRYAPFAATVSLFTAAMLVVVGADDLFLLLIGWEVMGFCSYLLVGHHSERPAAKRAALQAFLVTRVADIGFVVGILALAAGAGTTNVPRLLEAAGSIHPATLAVAMTGLVIGVAGKSAQFPFHGWLPDAMEGPTPVSALIHAATMVAAGVVVLVRLGPLLDRGGAALTVLAATACLSMLGAGVAALCSDDLKRVLAWSTVSQIAVMLAAVALGSDAGRAGALMLMLAHAAFKALLFLGAGIVAVRFGGTALAGVSDLWRRDRALTVLLGIGLAGLAALPPLAGFVGKEGVLTAAEHAVTGHAALATPMAVVVLACLALTTVVTGLYSGRVFGALVRLDRADPVATPAVAAEGPARVPAPAAASAPAPAAAPPSPATGSTVTAPGAVRGGEGTADPDPGAARPAASPVAGPPVRPERAGHPGPSFQAAPVPIEADPEDDSLAFVDGRGNVQDWDLIAHLDTARPPRWSRAGRERRAREADEARRRVEAGHEDKRSRRLSRNAPPRVRFSPGGDPAQPDAPVPPTAQPPTSQPPTSPQPAAAPPNRLARAMRDQRVRPAAQVADTSPLDVPGRRPRDATPVTPVPPAPPRPPRPAAEPVPGPRVPATMTAPVWVLALATLTAGVLPLLSPAGLDGFAFGLLTAGAGVLLALAGVGVGLLRGANGHRDLATRLPDGFRALAASGFGYQWAQRRLVVRPTQALARLTAAGDDAVIGAWLQAPRLLPWAGRLIAKAQTGQVSDYLAWVAGGVVVVATLAGLALSGAW